MHISNILPAAFAASALFAPFAAAGAIDCTFVFACSTSGNWDTSALSCAGQIHEGHVDIGADKDRPRPPVAEDLNIKDGCTNLHWKGSEYAFCHSGTSSDLKIREATVKRRGGDVINIIPDGEETEGGGADPVSASSTHVWWRQAKCLE